MSLAPGACAGISAESEAGSPLGGPSAPKRGTSQADWQFTTPPARRVKSEIQSAGYARRSRLLRDCGRGFNSRRLHLQRSRSRERLLGVRGRVSTLVPVGPLRPDCDIRARRVLESRGMAWIARLIAVVALAALAFPGGAAAFDAHGSVRQVYVTGVAPRARMALLKPSGRPARTKRADGLGGLLFRNVKPGRGYRVRPPRGGAASPPLTVLSARAAPPSTDAYKQSIPSSGYGYLTTRDGTRLAIDVHPPQDVTNALPGGVKLPPLPQLRVQQVPPVPVPGGPAPVPS